MLEGLPPRLGHELTLSMLPRSVEGGNVAYPPDHADGGIS